MSMFDNNPGDKRTLIAVILSVIVISAGFMIQGALFPQPPQPAAQAPATSSPVAPAPAAAPAASAAPASSIVAAEAPAAQAKATPAAPKIAQPIIQAPVAERKYSISTNLLEATFTNAGGELVSLKLKAHKDQGGFVDLLDAGSSAPQGLSLAFGGPASPPVRDLMNAVMIDDRTIEFSRSFLAAVPGKTEAQAFTLKKRFSFRDGEYMFGMAVGLENSVNEYLPLNQGGFAYTVTLGPQIGPKLSLLKKSANSDYRKFITYTDGKKKEETVKADVPVSPKGQPTWVALSGKYFSFIAIPEVEFTPTFAMRPDPEIAQSDSIALSRPAVRGSTVLDTYYFYFGPKTSAELAKYDYADRNGFKRADLRLENAMDNSNILGWLESILKFFLNIFYRFVPNYGVAIILTTVLVKVVLFPLTKKGSEGASRMQELQPQIQELQAKYKGNPQKLNQEMAEFYKRVGYNPMSGCFPLLIQFPLFIAMYNLFNNHFDLRGAMFIPGWIPDLSQPESIFNFPTLNLVIWQISAIRVLPVIYLLSQLLYGKFTQTAATAQSATQMKIMMYGMPIFFFFILYDVPSGLLIYWIATNILSIGQQALINDLLKKRKAAAAALAPAQAKIVPGKGSGPKIAPNKKK